MIKRSHFLQALTLACLLPFSVMGQEKPLMKSGAELKKETPSGDESLVGKKLWFVPNPKLYHSLRYGFATSSAAYVREEDRLYPEVPLTMEVVGDEGGSRFIGQLQVRLQDGSIAYLDKILIPMCLYNLDTKLDAAEAAALKLDLACVMKPDNDARELFFRCDPALLVKKLKDRQSKIAANAKARGGVKIGMTKEQVMASNWGKPSSINRTTSSGRAHEQWCYGGHNYLYFEDGILKTIQN